MPLQKNMRLLNRIVDRIHKRGEWDQTGWAQPTDRSVHDLPLAGEMSMLGLPDEYRHEEYRVMDPNLCGTAFCVAGHAVNMTRDALFLIEPGDRMAHQFFDMTNCTVGDIESEAQEILGLTADEASALFAADNQLEDIERMVGKWKRADA